MYKSKHKNADVTLVCMSGMLFSLLWFAWVSPVEVHAAAVDEHNVATFYPATTETARESETKTENSLLQRSLYEIVNFSRTEPFKDEKPDTNSNSTTDTIYQALRDAGLTNAGTAAVMGCMSMESGLQPTAENPYDGGYGLLQWTGTRRNDLFNWCAANGLDATTAYGQIEFFIEELKTVYSQNAGYTYPIYETLTSNENVETCLSTFFCHAEAGYNVSISSGNIYNGVNSTYELYNQRVNAAYNYLR